MLSRLTSLCFFLCLFFYRTYCFPQTNVDGIPCKTPDQIDGTCIELIECQPLKQLVQSLSRPLSTKVSQRLNSFKCDINGASVKVCCPPSPILIDPENSTPVQDRVDPPDVTNHKNLNSLPQTCGLLDTSEKIVGGNNAQLTEFPWMALFQYKTGNITEYRCAGTIIHKNYILTAAHCFPESGHQLVKIRVGEYSIKSEIDCEIQNGKNFKCNPPVQDLEVEEIIPHPKYEGAKGHNFNDIGLVRVSTINLDVENARPVCLPIGIVRDKPFTHVFVTGWGVTNIQTGEKSDILQKVGLPVVDKAACIKSYSGNGMPLTNTQICAGGKIGEDSCGGDSGGPMVVPTFLDDGNAVYIQQGIVSYGPRYCGGSTLPGVYTLVKFYMDWILDNIKP